MKFEFKKPGRAIDRVFIHCSASDRKKDDRVSVIKEWHLARGWSDTGYHYYVRKSGLIELGRPLTKVPAAQKGHNKGTIAICLGGLEEENFTEAQFNSLRAICHQIDDAYEGNVTFHGHCEVSNKTCPVFNYRAVLGLDASGYLLGSGKPPVSEPVEPAPTPSKPETPTQRPQRRNKRNLFNWLFGR